MKGLTNKKHVFYTDRGNTSIFLALKLAKHLGFKKLYIQDQGGWITYTQFAKKLNLELNYIETDYGIVKDLDIENSIVLINSMPGYLVLQEMSDLKKKSQDKNCFLINDVSGSIGTDSAKYGDLIIGSFGRWKPINLEYGGFIAFDGDYKKFLKDNFNKPLKDFSKDLEEAIRKLPHKLNKWKKITDKIKKQLINYDVVHRDKHGINVVVKFENAEQELELIDYCKLYNYEFTMCPRYIRIMKDAISIEVKRL